MQALPHFFLLFLKHQHCFSFTLGQTAYIIIMIIRHEVGTNRPVFTCLKDSSQIFQIVFVHLVNNLSLFLTSCCCSFLLHVVANFICTFIVSRRRVLLLTLAKSLHSIFCQQVCVSLRASAESHLD
jgi:hypothetical protein